MAGGDTVLLLRVSQESQGSNDVAWAELSKRASKQRQANHCEFVASLVYRTSSRTARATERSCLLHL